MIATIQPSTLSGTLQAPTSKSSMQRACAAALLRQGRTRILQPGRSQDDKAALEVIRLLGATVQDLGDQLLVDSRGVQPVSQEINCGESGLGIRMFTPIAALSERPVLINGRGSLLQRPMHFFDEILPELGVRVESNGGYLPLRIQGPLRPADIEVDGSLSSQFLTGLLMAYAASGKQATRIRVRDLKSKPYIDLTLQVLRAFGWQVSHKEYREFYFSAVPNAADQEEVRYTVEGDWSGAAFLLVAGALAGPVTVPGLDPQSTQADKAIIQALMQCGATLSIGKEAISVAPATLKAFQFDATECPDLFPPLVALASCCKGRTSIRGAGRLTHKESNRALTLQQEFGKMGIRIDLQGDLMHIDGGPLKGAALHSHHDHRIAMACAVAALRASGPSSIEVAEAIGKSYPRFYEDMQVLGARIQTGAKPPVGPAQMS